MEALSIPEKLDSYSSVILSMGMVTGCYFLISFGFTMRARSAVFKGTFMKEFKDTHLKNFPDDKRPPDAGYPDCGSGWYSKQLPYGDWFKMNCAQRCQMNYLEQLPVVLVAILIMGIEYPTRTLILSSLYCVARLMYSFGYMKSPRGRVVGAIAQDLILVAMLLTAYYVGVQFALSK